MIAQVSLDTLFNFGESLPFVVYRRKYVTVSCGHCIKNSSHQNYPDSNYLSLNNSWAIACSRKRCTFQPIDFWSVYGVNLSAVFKIYIFKTMVLQSLIRLCIAFLLSDLDTEIIFNLRYWDILLWHQFSNFVIDLNTCYSWLPRTLVFCF